ncbi:deoxyribonuclease IV [Acidilobus sp.]|uniref:deoxyribonuclease IV n=1 Tax=Acidilobus sp. TaxID=1872109 RepID=UPI003CFCD101
MTTLRFGPAGKPTNFSGDYEDVPPVLRQMGLDALEYEAVRGVRVTKEKAEKIREAAQKYDITLSMHAPYFINLASPEEETVRKSVERLREAAQASEWMGAYAVVFHPGYIKGNSSREEALNRVIEALRQVFDGLELRVAWLAPETTGKESQVGDVEETIRICQSHDRLRPAVDWAHLHARTEGADINSEDDVIKVIDRIEKELGTWAVKPLHTHFSKIEYGKGGEREHHTLGEKDFGPEWEYVCKAYVDTGIDGVIISESPILEQDALLMKKICEKYL